jgi:hypothetical protein
VTASVVSEHQINAKADTRSQRARRRHELRRETVAINGFAVDK